jgi:hypothetical protein
MMGRDKCIHDIYIKTVPGIIVQEWYKQKKEPKAVRKETVQLPPSISSHPQSSSSSHNPSTINHLQHAETTAHLPRLRSTTTSDQAVELISRSLVLGAALDSCLRTLASRHARGVGVADVGELVAEGVGDDVGVEGFALAAASKGVLDLEGKLVGGASVLAAGEDDGRCAFAEVGGATGCGSSCSSSCGGIVTGCCVVVVAGCGVLVVVAGRGALVLVVGGSLVGVLVLVVVTGSGLVSSLSSVALVLVVVGVVTSVLVGVVTGVLAGVVIAGSSSAVVGSLVATSSGIVILGCVSSIVAVNGTVISSSIVLSSSSILLVVVLVVAGSGLVSSLSSIALVLVGIVVASSLVATLSSTSGSSTTSTTLGLDKVTETGLVHQIEHTEAVSSKRGCSTALAESGGGTVSIDIRVNERGDTAELRSNRERSVTADVLGVAVGGRVGVLLSSDHAHGGSEGISTSTELSEDFVSGFELVLLVSCSKG